MMDFPVKRFMQDQIIFEEGEVGGVAYIIKEGSVKVSVKGDNKELVLAILRPGSIFGEMALLLKDSKRTATVTTLEDTAVILVHKKAFDEYIAQSPTVIGLLLSNLAERLYSTNEKLVKASDVSFDLREILNLIAAHNVEHIKYDEVVESLSRCFMVDPERMVEKLKVLESSKIIDVLIDDDGKKLIKLASGKKQ